jgi:hypothetical protein
MWIAAYPDQGLGWIRTDPKRHHPSCGDTFSGMAPPVLEGANGMDAEACPIATPTKDTSGASSSV